MPSNDDPVLDARNLLNNATKLVENISWSERKVRDEMTSGGKPKTIATLNNQI